LSWILTLLSSLVNMGQSSSRPRTTTTHLRSSRNTLPIHTNVIDLSGGFNQPPSNPEHGVSSRRYRAHSRDPRPASNNLSSRRALQTSTTFYFEFDPNPYQLQHSRPTKECTVCAGRRSEDRFPSRAPTAECTHPIDICRRCIRAWIESEFTTNMWDTVHCPICPALLEHEDMREFAPSHIFQRQATSLPTLALCSKAIPPFHSTNHLPNRYNTLYTNAILESTVNFRWCIARGCKSGQVHDATEARFRCAACHTSHCVKHGVSWHSGETCAEYETRCVYIYFCFRPSSPPSLPYHPAPPCLALPCLALLDTNQLTTPTRTRGKADNPTDVATRQLIESTTRPCPGCKRYIEKNGGCDHITCEYLLGEAPGVMGTG
jgi:hypothetical protein